MAIEKIRLQIATVILVWTASVLMLSCMGCGGVNKRDANDSKSSTSDLTTRADTVLAPLEHKSASVKNTRSPNDSSTGAVAKLLGEENNPMRFPHIIQFANGKTVDVTDVDPYKDLPYPILRDENGGLNRLYDLVGLNRSEIGMMLKGAHINEDAFNQMGFFRMFNKLPVIKVKKSKVAVAYHAAYFSSVEDILATQGYVLIYDAQGNLLHKIEDREHGFYDIRLSEDGKYLMQRYGTAYGEDGGGRLDMGFKFYDTKTAEMIFNWQLNKDQYISSYGNNGKISGFNIFRKPPNQIEWYYYIPETNNLFCKRFVDETNIDDEILRIHPVEKVSAADFINHIKINGFIEVK